MESVRKGLRRGDITKDTYERLACNDCGKRLGKRENPEMVGFIRYCPECGSEWTEIT